MQTLNELLVKTDGDDIVRLFDAELHTETCRRKVHHAFVTDHRDTIAIMHEVTDALVEFLPQLY